MFCGLGAVIQFLLAREAEDQRNNRLDDLRTGVTGETEGSILDTARLQVLSVLAGECFQCYTPYWLDSFFFWKQSTCLG